MDAGRILELLGRTLTVDLTTRGARSGRASRVEIWGWVVEGRYVITGTPGPRDWFANAIANPDVVVHVDGHDFAGTAHVVTDEAFRRRVFSADATRWYRDQVPLERLVSDAPMIEVTFA